MGSFFGEGNVRRVPRNRNPRSIPRLRVVFGVVVALVVGVAARESSFAGIRNQGNTCYLSSLVQTLFHVRPFRETVLRTCTSLAPPRRGFLSRLARGGRTAPLGPRSTGEALAGLFARLASNATGETRHLTRQLGVDPFEQQDAQEYLRLVLDELPDVSVYAGELERYLRVTDEEAAMIGETVESTRRERFLDVSLDVIGLPDLVASLRKFLAPETLEGDARWRTKSHGLRDAVAGARFVALPPVLVLHLKRFAYDVHTGATKKVDDAFEFPTHLDATSALLLHNREQPKNNESHDDTTNDTPGDDAHLRYRLHAVVCHVGSGEAGHYFAFVDPNCDGRWFKFDDHRVAPVAAADVLARGRGGVPGHGSAYLLQYVRLDYVPFLREDGGPTADMASCNLSAGE